MTLEWLSSYPLWWAKIGAMFLFCVVLSVVWLLPRHYVFGEAAEKMAWYHDLRIWATMLLGAQGILYTIF